MVEVLLVTIILAVAAAVVVPNFTLRSRQMELSSAAENVAYLIRFGQMHAMSKGRLVRLVFDNNACWLEMDSRINGDDLTKLNQKPDYRPVKDRWGRRLNLPQSIELTGNTEPVDLYPDGQLSDANIQVCRGTQCLLISTTRQLGRVSVIARQNNEDHEIL